MDKECAYNFSHEKRGIALLIHNEEYGPESGFKNRPGDNEDFKHMLGIFKELEFDVHPYRNLTSTEISKRAKEVSEMSKIHKNPIVLPVSLLHMEKKWSTDGQVVKTSDIVEMFNADNCEELKDKPKFFFIQACRTSNATVLGMDSGLAVTITERKQPQGGIVDGIEKMQVDSQIIDKVDANCISTNANSLCENNLDTRHLSSAERYLSRQQLVHHLTDVKCPDDTLLMFASLSSNYAVRNPTNGGWLLSSLYSQIKEHIDTGKICSTEFTQILNGALKEMTTKNFKPTDITSRLYGAFSPGCFTHCLSRDVLFLEKQYK
ncbi:CASP7 [Mytilus coruscus]|uniref:CASP7 n=1 Tax=Mytilus coruscus TaxID=42192 RepID=A0A6J8ECU5_MYTCO|nr:CASP7 [Mytilus coruscus]